MQTISLPWLAYSITGSAFMLGVIGAMQYLPVLCFSLFAGALADRFDKKKIVIFTQCVQAAIALILAFLVFSHQIRYWHLVVLSLAIGCITTLDYPARQSFTIEMIGKEDLMNAIGLSSAVRNGARIVGPAIAGILMAGLGMGWCFLINALSFLPLIGGLFFIRPIFSSRKASGTTNVLSNIVGGVRYLFSDGMLLKTMVTNLIIGTLIMNFNVLMPLLAKSGLHLKEQGLGFLWSSMGAGSLAGALFVAARSKHGPRNFVLTGAGFAVSFIFIIVGLNGNLIVTSFLLALSGLITVSFFTTANSFLQLNSKDEYRSMVISVYLLVNSGTTPIGNLLVGGLSQIFGIRTCFIILGVAVILMLSLLFLVHSGRESSRSPGNAA
jgi:MFS family permease